VPDHDHAHVLTLPDANTVPASPPLVNPLTAPDRAM
jgi:hypothetical protein